MVFFGTSHAPSVAKKERAKVRGSFFSIHSGASLNWQLSQCLYFPFCEVFGHQPFRTNQLSATVLCSAVRIDPSSRSSGAAEAIQGPNQELLGTSLPETCFPRSQGRFRNLALAIAGCWFYMVLTADYTCSKGF